MTSQAQISALLSEQIVSVETQWSLGTFGAIAEFSRDRNEPVKLTTSEKRIAAVTERGGVAISIIDELQPIASESPTTEAWNHRVALCLPLLRCAMNRRTELTELGTDADALRDEDRSGVLFDLGLSTLQVNVCIRSADPQVIGALRERAGKSIFAPGNDVMRIILGANPHRVFVSRIGRAEVFQPIPPPGGQSPNGPHTHLLPKLLAHGRTHAATEPLPEGWVPCAHVYPPHPLRDQFGRKRPFRRDCHDAFQPVLERYGTRKQVALKQQVIDAVTAGHGPSALTLPDDRFARAAVRVTLRQLQTVTRASPTLSEWLAAYDKASMADDQDPMEALH